MTNNRQSYVIASINNYIFDFIKDYMPQAKLYLLSNQRQLDSFLKDNLVIDTLIIDAVLDFSSAILISKNSINLTDVKIETSVKFQKPFLISIFTASLELYDKDDSIFCRLNNYLIYNQKSSHITNINNKNIIHLTTKENQIVTQLLRASDLTLMKHEIIAKIWPNASIEQVTLEFHLLNLKNKLEVIETSDRHVRILPFI
jgi:hypothetical protein